MYALHTDEEFASVAHADAIVAAAANPHFKACFAGVTPDLLVKVGNYRSTCGAEMFKA